jgi:mRNA-degrading endonuclease RelE of RelBE toxin-antitoxin system
VRVEVHARVRDYHRTLHPDARKIVKAALLALPRGDTRPLTDQLAGLHRLRVGPHRFIWRFVPGGIRVFYAAPRATVYEYLAAHLKELLG